ncbi:DUF1801 domain-containing protein [Salegentibacter sp. F188]|uniref:DUF1801 domain-containing protein n=1 Tax=Autumnicola patrickiae TaxID=3075591 RepID=A0ABU3DYA1_9FLAO|nr:DUF1801 domain-containing protein [Salegentibacter sp. F188]MDT0688698.1 DUF1801 domain-containing protein [Salegentibacter sp. F188]
MPVPSADQYVEIHPYWQEELLVLRKMLLSTALEEEIKWGAPVYTLNGKNVVGLVAFKNHCAMWFYNGASLQKNTDLLDNAQEGKTKALRQIKFRKGDKIDPDVLLKYVAEAIANQKLGRILQTQINSKLVLPPELKAAFNKDKDLKSSFAKLPEGKQREYTNYIFEAKREGTKQKRLEKIFPLIKQGSGLNDHYRKG